MKVCSKCHEAKPLDGFTRDQRKRDGLQVQCKACDNARRRRYRQANLESDRERQAAYRAANSERIAEYARGWRAENPEYGAKWRVDNPECMAEYGARYRAANPHINRETGYVYRARKFGFEPVVESFTVAEMIAHWGNGERCIYCDGPFEEMDHVIPVGLGGHHVISNVAPSCAPCNRQNIATVIRSRKALAA